MIESSIPDTDKAIEFLQSLDSFQSIDEHALKDLTSSMSCVYVNGSEVFIKEGELEKALYILWHGRLQVFTSRNDAVEISAGELVGEMAILGNQPRTANVKALRDSMLLKWSHEAFEEFEAKYPHEVLKIGKNAVKRLSGKSKYIHPGEKVVTLAIVSSSDSDASAFTEKLIQKLSKIKKTILVNASICNQQFNQEISESSLEGEDHQKISKWLHSLENPNVFVVYEADNSFTSWTQRCIRQADSILLVADDRKSPELNETEKHLFSNETFPCTDLIMIHPNETKTIKGTRNWLRERPVRDYHHLKLENSNTLDRLVRFLTGNAVGVVFSGGGVRGFAHVGLLKALEENNIPIDFVGGVSMGAVVAGFYAAYGLERTIKTSDVDVFREYIADFTLPLVALMKEEKANSFFQDFLGFIDIEDLWLPMFCIAANLTTTQIKVIDRGVLWEALRTTVAIPGIMPPMYNEKNEILVDGAILNNLPIDIMREYVSDGTVIAGRCSIEDANASRIKNYGPAVSGWKLLMDYMKPSSKKQSSYDSIIRLLVSSFFLNSTIHSKETAKDADVLVNFEFLEFDILDLNHAKALVDRGYQATIEQLGDFFEKYKQDHEQ